MLIVLLILSLGSAKELLATEVEQSAKLAANKAIVVKFAEEVLNNRKIDVIDELVQPDVILHLQSNWRSPISGTSQVVGKDNLKKHYEAFFAIWDKKAEWFKTTIEEVIAEGDTVAVRAARVYKDRKSGAVVNRTAMVFYKLKDGKIGAMYLLVAGPTEP
jgi:ketosteroid isomerase-like protein